LADEPGGRDALHRFASRLALLSSGGLALLWATPLAELWFRDASGLPDALVDASTTWLVFGVLMPGYAVWTNYYQGLLVQAQRTRAVTAAVLLYVAVSCALLAAGVAAQAWPGLPGALAAFTLAGICQNAYLRRAVLALGGDAAGTPIAPDAPPPHTGPAAPRPQPAANPGRGEG
jgi:hypothetical protein